MRLRSVVGLACCVTDAGGETWCSLINEGGIGIRDCNRDGYALCTRADTLADITDRVLAAEGLELPRDVIGRMLEALLAESRSEVATEFVPDPWDREHIELDLSGPLAHFPHWHPHRRILEINRITAATHGVG